MKTVSSSLPFMLDEDLHLLIRRAELRSFEAGQAILREGSDPTGIYIVEAGQVAVVRGDVEIGVLPEGSLFGEMSLLMEQPTSASVIARGPTQVGFVSRDKLDRLLATYPSLAARYHHSLAKVLADRLKRASGELAGGASPPTLSLEIAHDGQQP